MTNYQPRTSFIHKLAVVAATVVIGVGTLQWVAGAMTHPDPETMAARQQVLAAQSERALAIRTLQRGELQLATAAQSPGL